ncbi:hypothetical protein LguiA_014166 [Lonicera macranthoides]
MAWPLANHLTVQNYAFLGIPVTSFIILITIFSVFSTVTFLCLSLESIRSRRHRKDKSAVGSADREQTVSRLRSSISSKALLMAKMISWRKVQNEGEEAAFEDDDDDEEALWKRTIIMGERCRPLDFPGKNLYDSNGNPLPNSPLPSNGNGLTKP